MRPLLIKSDDNSVTSITLNASSPSKIAMGADTHLSHHTVLNTTISVTLMWFQYKLKNLNVKRSSECQLFFTALYFRKNFY